MRRALLPIAAVAVLTSGGAAWSACGATIGAAKTPLTSNGAAFSIGLDGSVRHAIAPLDTVDPGSVDASGRYTVLWKHGGRSLLVRLDGGRSTTIATRVASSPTWAPTGDSLAFGQLVSGAVRLRIATLGSVTRVRQLRVPICNLGGTVWSPDGRYLGLVSPDDERHCERGSQLVVVDVRSGAITGRTPIADPVPGQVVWSADGRFAAESSIIGTAGVAIVPRSTRIGQARFVAGCAAALWSPRGATLAASCGGVLALIDPYAGARTDLPVDGVALGRGPQWSHDGRRVAVATERGIALTTTDGRTHAVAPVEGCWAGGVIGFTRDGRALVQASVAPPSD